VIPGFMLQAISADHPSSREPSLGTLELVDAAVHQPRAGDQVGDRARNQHFRGCRVALHPIAEDGRRGKSIDVRFPGVDFLAVPDRIGRLTIRAGRLIEVGR